MARRFFAPFVLLLVAFALAAPGPARAAVDPAKAEEFVESVANRGINLVLEAEVGKQERVDRFRDLFLEHFDVDAISRFVLGRHARAADQAELERFQTLFREYNILVWAQRFDDYQGQELIVTSTRPDGDTGIFVESKVVDEATGSEPINIVWRLRERSEGLRVVDLVVEGVSMALTYRSEYDSIISRDGLKALNDLLEQKVNELSAS